MTLDPRLARWRLALDGAPIVTPNSRLYPVRQDGVPLMLKIALHEEERRGAAVMSYYAGEGAARVLACEGEALLLERASGGAPLVEMARRGRDDDASRIICATVARLHAPRPSPAPTSLVPLQTWFRDLDTASAKYGGLFATAGSVAKELLTGAGEATVLHGDIHHGNILHDETRGWLAIDPKGLVGDRCFDYANIFCNPDMTTATATGRLQRQACTVAAIASLQPHRLVQWVFAYACLSASWSLTDGEDSGVSLAVAEIAARELGIP